MTAAHPIGAGNAREEVEYQAEIDAGLGLEDPSMELVDERGRLAERLAELDYALTGTACYALTWAERLDRIARLQASDKLAGYVFAPRAGQRG